MPIASRRPRTGSRHGMICSPQVLGAHGRDQRRRGVDRRLRVQRRDAAHAVAPAPPRSWGSAFSSPRSSARCARLTISAIAPTLFRTRPVPVQLDDPARGAGRARRDRQPARAAGPDRDRLPQLARAVRPQWFFGSLKVSTIVTLIFGIFGTLIELLQVRLNDATVALRTKERDEADARRLAAEAQLASIESRVQPHFLFNTLNSIAALVHDDPGRRGTDDRPARRAAALGARQHGDAAGPARPGAPRSSAPISTSSGCASAIGCATTSTSPTASASAMVPRMALQTLVENSVKYAVSPRREGGIDPRHRDAARRPRPHHRRRRWAGVRRRAPAGGARPGAARRAAGDAVRRPRLDARRQPRRATPAITIDVPAESAISSESAIRNPRSAS